MDLLNGTNQWVWHRTFVSTYMQFASTQLDPWDIPSTLACKKLQIIWDVIFPDIKHTVTTTSAVYILVSASWNWFMLLTIFCRFCNNLLIHGITPLVLLLFLFTLHTLNHKMTYRILTRIMPNCQVHIGQTSILLQGGWGQQWRGKCTLCAYDVFILTLLNAEFLGLFYCLNFQWTLLCDQWHSKHSWCIWSKC